MSAMKHLTPIVCCLFSAIICAGQTLEARKAEAEQQRANLLQRQDSLRREREARRGRLLNFGSRTNAVAAKASATGWNATPDAKISSGFHAGSIRSPDLTAVKFDGKGECTTIKVCTRVADDGQDFTFLFRTFTIAPDGSILSIGEESCK